MDPGESQRRFEAIYLAHYPAVLSYVRRRTGCPDDVADAIAETFTTAMFHPIGYPLLLWALRPFHSVVVIAAVQHVLGLGVGLLVYAVLRRHSVPVWGATLATVPVLFDASFLRLEQAVLSDTLFIFLVVAALAVLLWRPVLTSRAAAAAGLLLAWAALTRTVALPLLVVAVLYLLLRRARRRALIALTVAGAAPLVAYAGWFHHYCDRAAPRGLLPWSVAVTLLVAPVAVLDFDHRYVLPVVPVACLAGALAVAAPAQRSR
jgi:hypothetical protein